VSTPVWVAPGIPDTGELVVITVGGTGKVKRLARDPHVEMAACNQRGQVAPGAPTYGGTARVVDAPDDVLAVKRAIGAKYGLFYRVFTVVEAALIRVRPRRHPRAGVVIVPEHAPREPSGR